MWRTEQVQLQTIAGKRAELIQTRQELNAIRGNVGMWARTQALQNHVIRLQGEILSLLRLASQQRT